SLPEAYGGSGLGMVETAILLDEMGRAAYPGPYLPTVLAAHAVDSAGTTEQKNRWLPAIATGGARATTAFVDADLACDPQATASASSGSCCVAPPSRRPPRCSARPDAAST